MIISMLLMLLVLAAGSGTGQSVESNSAASRPSDRNFEIKGECYVNGALVNPCPSPTPRPPSPPEGPRDQTPEN